MTLVTIGEFAQISGVPTTTLRYYDRIRLLQSQRLSNNHRRYPLPDALDQLRLIQLCQALGAPLDEVAELVRPGNAAGRRTVARRRLVEVDARMAELMAAKAVLEHFARCRHSAATADDCRGVTRAALLAIQCGTAEQAPWPRTHE
jgi:DNA-binding transcriptional MerR regulator